MHISPLRLVFSRVFPSVCSKRSSKYLGWPSWRNTDRIIFLNKIFYILLAFVSLFLLVFCCFQDWYLFCDYYYYYYYFPFIADMYKSAAFYTIFIPFKPLTLLDIITSLNRVSSNYQGIDVFRQTWKVCILFFPNHYTVYLLFSALHCVARPWINIF